MPDPSLEEEATSQLVEHAIRELDLSESDQAFKDCIIGAVREFAKYGHSGGSASVGIHILNDLLQFKNLTRLTDDPDEWMLVDENIGGPNCWQSRRNPEAFSTDGGKTHYLLSDGNSFQEVTIIRKSKTKE